MSVTGLNVTALSLFERFLGVEELETGDHPLIQWGFKLCRMSGETPDEVPWCSAILQIPCDLLELPRSGSAAARSWLKVGEPIELAQARQGFDVVVLQRGDGPQPGPEVIQAPGHVGMFREVVGGMVILTGGNQGNRVSRSPFPVSRVLGVRRLV